MGDSAGDGGTGEHPRGSGSSSAGERWISGDGDRLSDADGGGLSGEGRKVLGDAGGGGGVGRGSCLA